MSMAHSLEARVPFLDRAMVELARRIPRTLRLRGLTTKYLLRRAMARPAAGGGPARQEARLQRPDAGVARRRRCATSRATCCRRQRLRRQGLFDPAAVGAAGRRAH